MKIAVYPGSFDPITNGHIDIIERASRLFDRLVVGIAHNPDKKCVFTLEERRKLLEEVLEGLHSVEVASFSKLLVDFAKEKKASTIIRGLRAVTDFDYEYAMFQVNAEMHPGIDTVFLLAAKEYSFLSSSLIKELAGYGRSIDRYTPEPVRRALLTKFGEKQRPS